MLPQQSSQVEATGSDSVTRCHVHRSQFFPLRPRLWTIMSYPWTQLFSMDCLNILIIYWRYWQRTHSILFHAKFCQQPATFGISMRHAWPLSSLIPSLITFSILFQSPNPMATPRLCHQETTALLNPWLSVPLVLLIWLFFTLLTFQIY